MLLITFAVLLFIVRLLYLGAKNEKYIILREDLDKN